MNKTLFTAIAIFFIAKMSAQDKIFTHSGDTLMVSIKEIGHNNIKFIYPAEQITNTISKNVISSIEFENGRKQIISDKIIINGKKDWEKVIVTNLESDIEGLTKVGSFKAKAKGTTFTSQGRVESRAMDKLKKESAEKGCHILLILTTTGKSGSPYSSASSSLTAIGYKY